MRLVSLLSGFCVLATTALPSTALAADPVTAGMANIGSHPTYGPFYAGFWRTGADYSLLSDGTNTFLNAPMTSGAIYFRIANADHMILDSTGLGLFPNAVNNTSLFVGGGSFPLGIGRHPWYGGPYVGLWLAGNCWNCATSDYVVLTDGQDTFLNAPNPYSSIWFRGGNSDRMRLSSGALSLSVGTAEKPGGGSWSGTSDLRVKKDVRNLPYGLAALERVRPVTYKYNGLGGTRDDNTEFVGVIAQELEKTLPFMVTSTREKLRKDDKEATAIKHVDPSAFSYVLINAVKELAAQNKQMKKILCMDHPAESFCSASKAASE